MSVRPFWVDVNIDGRKTNLEGGPRAKDGQMHIKVLHRSNGAIEKAYTINCYPGEGKDLVIDILDSNGELVHRTKSVY